jgi:hypothetical protein
MQIVEFTSWRMAAWLNGGQVLKCYSGKMMNVENYNYGQPHYSPAFWKFALDSRLVQISGAQEMTK